MTGAFSHKTSAFDVLLLRTQGEWMGNRALGYRAVTAEVVA